ncbi:cytochrome P450 [Streptomyces sp. NPDC052020]|uniref:cytochrome P450 n=1 Tax=Streptomyces sp. NPDC052020 TaxID=3155677 RepID=UPI003421EB0B
MTPPRSDMTIPPAAPSGPRSGPRGQPLLGNLFAFARDPLRFMVRLREDFGDQVLWSLGRRRCLTLSHPRLVNETLQQAEAGLELLDAGWAARQVVGHDSVIFTKGEEWRHTRAMLHPALRPRMVRRYAAVMAACAAAHADRWRDGDRVDVQEEMTRVTQDIVLRILFGATSVVRSSGLRDAMATVQREIGDEFSGLGAFLPGWVPLPYRRRVRTACGVIDEAIYRLIRERRARAAEVRERDVLDTLLAQRDPQGRPLSDRDVRNQVLALWVGGHESTTTTLTWAWLALAGQPHARLRLHAELRQVLDGRSPGYDDYDRLPYTQQVVKETLRLYPPLWALAMTASRDTVVGTVPVKAGTLVWTSQWSVHRDPRWYPEPEAFRPERFAAGAAGTAADDAWFPFGAGPRACLGARFALVEVALVLATLAQRFHLDISGGRPAPRPGMFLKPSTPVYATLRAVPPPDGEGPSAPAAG